MADSTQFVATLTYRSRWERGDHSAGKKRMQTDYHPTPTSLLLTWSGSHLAAGLVAVLDPKKSHGCGRNVGRWSWVHDGAVTKQLPVAAVGPVTRALFGDQGGPYSC